MTDNRWETLVERIETMSRSTVDGEIALAVTNLGRRVEELASQLTDKGDFDRRLAALKEARTYVAGVVGEPGRHGTTANTLTPKDRITEELRVAGYLLGRDID